MSGVVQFGAELFSDLEAAGSREWLVTNGIGGYASGTLAGGMSRRYHGLLVAALRPPVGRTQLVAWIDEIVRYNGAEFALATHRWASGAIEPQDFNTLKAFVWKGRCRCGLMPSATRGWRSAFGCSWAQTPPTCNTRWCREVVRWRWC